MTALLSHLFLQQYWWIIVSLLAGLLVLLMFVQGGQSFIFSLPGNDIHKTMIINAIGRKWEFTFTTLVTFGGAFFASFPLFYATSFGGAYWVWMAILFSFIIQAVAYEYRSKPGNILGQNIFDIFLLINGSLGPFLIGVAVATFFTGSQFTLDDMNHVKWGTQWYGLESLLNIQNLALGFAVLFLSRINGLLYIMNSISDEGLHGRAIRKLILNVVPFLGFFLYFVVALLLAEGFAYDPMNGKIVPEKYKYLSNFIQMPAVAIIFLLGVTGVLYGIGLSIFRRSSKGIWFSGGGTTMAVFSMFLIAGFNGTSFYPSVLDLQCSLTISNASSSRFTLKAMMYVSFIIPFVVAYIWYAWKAISNEKITEEEMGSDDHKY
jgi:cytochrome bd ubiquinol oxidase subunit II